MKKDMPKIQVLDNQTEQVLFECDIDQAEKAYEFAAEMEEMGLDLKVVNPTLADTLSSSLGLSGRALVDYRDSIQEEMEDHDAGCCVAKDDGDKTVH